MQLGVCKINVLGGLLTSTCIDSTRADPVVTKPQQGSLRSAFVRGV